MTVQGYNVEIIEAPRHFIRLSDERKHQCAWGRKAAKAIRDLAKLQASGDDYALKVWLVAKYSNGF